jgi:hypothetical protein
MHSFRRLTIVLATENTRNTSPPATLERKGQPLIVETQPWH